MEILYRIFAELDRIVYSIVSQIFLVISDISKYNFFSAETISDFLGRVYVVLGVLMLFKVVIAAVQYLVNPDLFDDKNKGFAAILKKTLIVVVLLAVVPAIFNFAVEVENTIVDAIPKAIFGNADETSNSSMEDIGKSLSLSLFKSFVSAKTDKVDNKVGYTIDNLDDPGNIPNLVLDGCNAAVIWEFDKFMSGAKCNYNYMFWLSPVIGLFMVYILGSMTIDIGIRVIKFGIVRILAPIPIASYIDDEKKFNNWVKTSIQIYTDLFIRLGVVYFVVYFLKNILGDFLLTTGYPQDLANQIGHVPQGLELIIVKVLIIIALLLFAKNAPKFICDLLGFEGANESIGDMFKRAGGLFGSTVGGFRTARSNYTTQKERAIGKGQKHPKLAGLKSAAAGLGSGIGRGMLMAGQGKGFNDVRQNAFQNAIKARNSRNDRVDNLYNTRNADGTKMERYDQNGKLNESYYGYSDYRRDVRRERMGIPTSTAFTKVKYDVVDKIAQDAGAEKSFGATKMNETPNEIKVTRKIDDKNYDFTIATARAYAAIQVGTKAQRWDGVDVIWSVDDQAKAMQIQQEVEKRTSYVKVAKLIANDDPTSKMNRDKTILEIKSNRTSIDTDTLKTVYESLVKAGKLPKSVIGEEKDFTVDKIISLLEKTPAKGDDAAIEQFADILTGVKDGFERARTDKYTQAQAADARAKKTQEAINNNKDKK